jgi:molybdopterin synthase sulfur carrier subunit
MQIEVEFYSYFKEFTGTGHVTESLEPGSRVCDLIQRLVQRFPKLAAAQNSMLIAVGLDYQKGDYRLKPGDRVALFPPVQGG